MSKSFIEKYPARIMKEILNKELSLEYRESLFLTCKDLLGFSEMTHFTHGPMIEALENESKNKLIVMPRGTFKSSVCVVGFAIWRLLKNPNERILIDSELYENSKNFIREIRGKLESKEMVDIFGEFKTRQWAEGSITINQRTKVMKESSITAGGIGTGKTGQHYTIIIHDDMNSAKNSQTMEQRKKVIDHYRLNTSILDPGGTTVVVGTRYSDDDLIGHVLKNEIEAKPEKGLLK